MKDIIRSFGRYDVVRETLSDGSYVFSVAFPSDDGALVILACYNGRKASQLAEFLQVNVVDVSLRDKEGASA